MDTGQLTETAVPSVAREDYGPAFLVGLFLGFHLIVIVLSVWLFGATPQDGELVDLSLNYLVLIVVAFVCLGDAPYRLRFLRSAPAFWALFFLAFSGCSLAWNTPRARVRPAPT